jgi:hypothetical protein
MIKVKLKYIFILRYIQSSLKMSRSLFLSALVSPLTPFLSYQVSSFYYKLASFQANSLILFYFSLNHPVSITFPVPTLTLYLVGSLLLPLLVSFSQTFRLFIPWIYWYYFTEFSKILYDLLLCVTLKFKFCFF